MDLCIVWIASGCCEAVRFLFETCKGAYASLPAPLSLALETGGSAVRTRLEFHSGSPLGKPAEPAAPACMSVRRPWSPIWVTGARDAGG